MKDKIFIDTNVLVYLSDQDSIFHKTAIKFFKSILNKYEIWISRQILREYAVIVSRKGLIERPLKPKEVNNDIEKWQKIFNVADETDETTEKLKYLISKYKIKGKRIHDTNIVASMIEKSIPTLFTFNIKDFKGFEEIKLFDIM